MTDDSDDSIDFEYPEDEYDYYVKLLDESHKVGHQMIESTDPQEKERLLKHYLNLQEWLEEIEPTNAWYRD